MEDELDEGYPDDYSDGVSDESDPLADSSGSEETKAREELFGADIETLLAETQNRGRKGRRRGRLSGQYRVKRKKPWDVPPHLTSVMGAATNAYVTRRPEDAIALLKQVVEGAPKAAIAHRTLGLIYDEQGQRKEALESYMIAASLDKGEKDLWKRNAVLWEEEGQLDQAISCLTAAIKVSRGDDVEALLARGDFRIRQKQFRKAADNFAKVHVLLPNDVDVLKKLVGLYKECKLLPKAVTVLEAAIDYFQHGFPRRDGITTTSKRNSVIMELVQLLVEIWFKQKKYSESSNLLSRVKDLFSSTGSPMTFEQRLLLAICQHRLGAETLASPTFIEFMASPSMMDKHQSLLWEVADACLDSGEYRRALQAYDLLDATTLYKDDLNLFLRRATCHKELNNIEKCKLDLLAVLRIKPRHMEASMKLVAYYPELARLKKNEANKKRRLRRKEKLATTVPALPLLPEASTSEIKAATIPRVGFDYLTKGTELSAVTTNESIYVNSNPEDIRRAFHLVDVANAAFKANDYEKCLRVIGPPIETALNLQVKLYVEEVQEQQGEDDEENIACVHRQPPDELENNGEGNSFPLKKRRSSGSSTGPEGNAPDEDAGISAEENPRHLEIGASILRDTNVPVFVEVLENIFHSLYYLDRIEDIEPVMSSLLSIAAVRVTPDSHLKLRVQALLITSLFSTGRHFDAFSKLRQMLMETPEDPRVCCLFALAEEHLGVATTNERFKAFRVLDRLAKKRSELPLLMYANALCSARGLNNSHNYTIGKFFSIYGVVSSSPLICLCLVVQLIYLAQNRRVGNRNEMVLYALACLDQYRRKRRARAMNKCALVVELELLYNTGRSMHQLGLYHMAEELYRDVLKCGEDKDLPSWADLRREAAFNLIHIYKQSNATDAARELMQKYLMF